MTGTAPSSQIYTYKAADALYGLSWSVRFLAILLVVGLTVLLYRGTVLTSWDGQEPIRSEPGEPWYEQHTLSKCLTSDTHGLVYRHR
jgi:hypothetical protein